MKAGHFYSIVGHEGVQAAGTFFYSKSYSYQFGGPFTHWGVLGSHNVTDQLQIQGGATMGWNTLYSDQNNVSGIAGIKYTGCDKNWWTSFAITSGAEPNNVAGLPGIIPGGVPENPMGAAAMTLAGGEYAIHGTNDPRSIGGFVSYGCIRMHNQDIVDLFDRVQVGTRVIVTH